MKSISSYFNKLKTLISLLKSAILISYRGVIDDRCSNISSIGCNRWGNKFSNNFYSYLCSNKGGGEWES